jgi:hypothetical protein
MVFHVTVKAMGSFLNEKWILFYCFMLYNLTWSWTTYACMSTNLFSHLMANGFRTELLSKWNMNRMNSNFLWYVSF